MSVSHSVVLPGTQRGLSAAAQGALWRLEWGKNGEGGEVTLLGCKGGIIKKEARLVFMNSSPENVTCPAPLIPLFGPSPEDGASMRSEDRTGIFCYLVK